MSMYYDVFVYLKQLKSPFITIILRKVIIAE